VFGWERPRILPRAVFHDEMDSVFARRRLVLYVGGMRGEVKGTVSSLKSSEGILTQLQTRLGSTKNSPSSIIGGGATGLFDEDPSVNPFFHDFNKVFVQYCDGASYSGDLAAPVHVNGTTLYFRGHRVLTQIFAHLRAHFGMDAATEVLLSGCSAGGLATYLHADYVATLLPPTVKRYKAAAVSGFFLNHTNVDGVPVYPLQMVNVFHMQNATNGVNAQCVAANPTSPARCIFAENTYPFIQTPFFVANSMYDAWSLANILTVNQADSHKWSQCIQDLGNCTDKQVKVLNGLWQVQFLERIMTSSNFWQNRNGCFVHSIVKHCGEESRLWNAEVKIGGLYVNQAWGQWYSDQRSTSRFIGCALNEVPPYQCADL
jgi:hypothetical protein